MELVLASSSRYRRELLERFGVPFASVSPNVDETPLPGEAPRDMVLRLSLAKAKAAAQRHPSAVVVGSDQAAVFKGRILGKPGSAERAVANLLRFAGKAVEFVTGVVVLNAADGRVASHVDSTTSRFREFTAAEAKNYVRLDQPLDCAGGIRFESRGALLLHGVDTSDPSAGIGLPLIELGAMLRDMGINPLAERV